MSNSLLWLPTTIPPTLAENELHVWRASLDVCSAAYDRMERFLSGDERERAAKFKVPGAHRRYVAARGILRELLSGYLKLEATEIDLHYGPQGKPFLSPAHSSDISFNASHSNGVGLFAIARSGEIGADVEQVKVNFKGMEIASRFFSESEVEELAGLPPKEAEEAFFRCWTKKEAYVKAHGMGLGMPLRSFAVRFNEDEQSLRDMEGKTWSCYAVRPAAGYVGAIVAQGEEWTLKYCEWPTEADTSGTSELVD